MELRAFPHLKDAFDNMGASSQSRKRKRGGVCEVRAGDFQRTNAVWRALVEGVDGENGEVILFQASGGVQRRICKN